MPILLVGFLIQTVRIDGFPLFGDGLRQKLTACENVNLAANQLAQDAVAKAREEGRITAAADSLKLVQDETERRKVTDKTITDLRIMVARLRPVPPRPIVVTGPPPVRLPPLPVACKLDQTALDSIRSALNEQRGMR